MGWLELVMIAVGLSMDAFAVSLCKGLSLGKVNWKHCLKAGLYFGGFQMGMPILGYYLGSSFSWLIQSVDHWIAFGLLAIIGGNMIRESFQEEECPDPSMGVKAMLLLAVATSIDALAVGISFAFLQLEHIWLSCGIIGIITCVLSMIGIKLGSVAGSKRQSLAERIGGIILILIGVKILLEHLGILPF